jgi:hypothetical protein
MKIKEIFDDKRIVGLAGEKSSGKTNNLVALIKEFREKNKETEIYIYGVDEVTLKYLINLKNVFEVSSLDQLTDKKDCLIIIDEMQRLKLNDRRYKDILDKFIDFIYHSNNWVIFSSPNLREFNSIIGSKIEKWALKSLRMNDLVNGSHLKEVVLAYNGRYKIIDDIRIDKDKMLIINNDYEKVITLPYIKEVDSKIHNKSIFV